MVDMALTPKQEQARIDAYRETTFERGPRQWIATLVYCATQHLRFSEERRIGGEIQIHDTPGGARTDEVPISRAVGRVERRRIT